MPSCHHVIMSSCHHVIMSSCHHVIIISCSERLAGGGGGLLSPPPPPFLKGKHAHRGFFPSTTPYPYPHKYQQTACRLSILARGGQPKNRISKSRCALFGASASGLRERRGGRGIVREGLSWANGSNNLVRFSPLRNLYSLRWWVDVSPVSCCALFRLNSDQDPRELKGDSSVTGLGWSGVDGVGSVASPGVHELRMRM